MKSHIKNSTRTFLTLFALLFGMTLGHSDVTVGVDSTLPWLGYMNVYDTAGAYQQGFPFGTADLRAAFIPTNGTPFGWPLNTDLVLKPNTNTYNPADIYWNNPDGSPNKVLEANFYRDVGTNFAEQTVTFTGTVTSNTIPTPPGGPATGWTSVCFVKEFSVGYGTFFGSTEVALPASGAFSVSRPIGAGHVSQYGFYVKGPNTAPGSPNSLTGIGVLVEDSDPAITNQPVGLTVTSGATTNLSVGAIGSAVLTYQWKTNGVNLVNGAKYSGVDTKTLTIANAQPSDSGDYVVTVSNTVTSTTVDSLPAQVNVLDILVTTNPVSQRVEQNSTVVFSVAATSSSSLLYRWKSVIGGVTNNLVNGPGISGAQTPTLTLSNVQVAASGTYLVQITALPSGRFLHAGATLLVKSYADYANFLENPGFENDTNGLDETPWIRFESTDPSFGRFVTTNDTYYGGVVNVDVLAGSYVSFTTFAAAYSGIYQDVAASPGQTFAADMWFYNPSADPIPGPSPIENESFIEIQFRNSPAGTPLQQYISPFMTYATPQDVWFNLTATNAGGYGTLPPGPNGKYLVAPPGTTMVRFQVTMHDIAGSAGFGSLYYDSARLMLKTPVTLSSTLAGSTLNLSWKTQGATSYQVQYKDDLNAATWTNLEVVAGDGTVITKSYPTSGNQRLYRVLTL